MGGYNPDWKCYPIVLRPTDSTVEMHVTHEKEYDLALLIGELEIPLKSRDRVFAEDYIRTVVSDIPYVNNLDHEEPDGDYGTPARTDYGHFSDDFSYLNSEILFIDARNGSYVIASETGSVVGEGSGSDYARNETIINPVPAIMTGVDLKLVVPVTVPWTTTKQSTLRVKVGTPGIDETIISEEETVTAANYRLGITSGEGMVIGSFVMSWGDFDVIDTDFSYSIYSFTPKYHIPLPLDRRLEYNLFDYLTFSDAMDLDHFEAFKLRFGYFGGWPAVVEPVVVDKTHEIEPTGSWAEDANKNIFVSMLTDYDDPQVINKIYDSGALVVLDAASMIADKEVYFPVAPV